jgi:hypothetical protein
MTQEVLKFTKAITEPNTITFHNSNADWVMRITADRRIEVNEDVEVTEAAQKVLDAMQYLLKAQTQEPVSNDPLPRACNLAGVDYQTFLKIKAYMPVAPPQRTWVGLTDEQLRTEFGKLYPNDIGILELAENNRDFAVEAIGARHHWVAF